MEKQPRHFYDFGPFRLDAAERLLLRDGRPVPLTSKVFETLLVLVSNKGHVVEKDELMQKVWHGAFVEEGNLSQNIFVLRKALGESRHERRYIETIPKRGYRFVATVRESAQSRIKPRLKVGEEDADAINSLVVMPFVNQSNDPAAEYLSDGITESIINSLSPLPNLRVMSRNTAFHYKNQRIDPQDVGRELGVRAVLVGRVLQFEDTLIVGAELIDVADGAQLWGEQYHRKPTDIFSVQEEISKVISEKLRLRLTGAERELLAKRYTDDTEAYQRYFKGRYFWNKYTEDGVKKSIQYFNQAIEIDPNFALAYVGLADSYYRLSNLYLPPEEALSKSETAALKALEIDEMLAEAHASLAHIKIYRDWNWREGERELKRAIELNPGYAAARQRYGVYLALMGSFDEALAELKTARDLDPLSLSINLSLATLFYVARRHEQAIEQIKETLEIDANFHMARGILGMVYAQQGDFRRAVAELQEACRLDNTPVLLRFLGHTYAVSGQRSAAQKVLKKLRELSEQSYVPSYGIAVIYAGLGEKDQAFQWLEKAYEDRSEGLGLLKVSPELDNLRSDSRFADLMRRIGLTP